MIEEKDSLNIQDEAEVIIKPAPKKPGRPKKKVRIKPEVEPEKKEEPIMEKKDTNKKDSPIGGSIHVVVESNKNFDYETIATGQKASQKSDINFIRLLRGRIYYVPVKEKHINSDKFETLKIYSSMSSKIDVRFVKDGMACIVPLQHGVILKTTQHICTIF